MCEKRRARGREVAQRYLSAGDALGWFEALYAEANGDPSIIPWADLRPSASLTAWLDRLAPVTKGTTALAIGCGLGDDAEELARRGFETTAFDISPTAILWCRRRHPGSPVSYATADLLHPPLHWQGRFDFVLESYTLQVLPAALRLEAIRHVASFVAPSGVLLVIARAREETDPKGAMPWPVTRRELDAFQALGLKQAGFEDYWDKEDPPVRRFRVSYQRA